MNYYHRAHPKPFSRTHKGTEPVPIPITQAEWKARAVEAERALEYERHRSLVLILVTCVAVLGMVGAVLWTALR